MENGQEIALRHTMIKSPGGELDVSRNGIFGKERSIRNPKASMDLNFTSGL